MSRQRGWPPPARERGYYRGECQKKIKGEIIVGKQKNCALTIEIDLNCGTPASIERWGRNRTKDF